MTPNSVVQSNLTNRNLSQAYDLNPFVPEETNQPESDQLLIDAVMRGDVEVVRERIADGAFVDSRRGGQYTVLMIAAALGHVSIFEMLVDAGAIL